jgi:predicted DNA-binding protein (MmcQ/YjbR family)
MKDVRLQLEQEETRKTRSLSNRKSFSIRIAEHLHKRFSKHIEVLKYVKKSPKNKTSWIEEAFLEKLAAERELNMHHIPDEKYLHFKISEAIFDEIEERVNIIKKFRYFSKKQWMIEALYEKLEKEEQEAKILIQSMLNTTSKVD